MKASRNDNSASSELDYYEQRNALPRSIPCLRLRSRRNQTMAEKWLIFDIEEENNLIFLAVLFHGENHMKLIRNKGAEGDIKHECVLITLCAPYARQ